MTALEDLRELFLDPARWTRGAFAKDEQGKSIPPGNMEAVCWCAMGGMQLLGFNRFSAAMWNAIPPEFQPSEAFSRLTLYNDSLENHQDLIAWIDRAIALEEKPH